MNGVTRIVSGGQTGADRGGLDAAISLGIAHGGWCPQGRKAEDGRIPSCYELQEAPNRSYAWRRRRNILDSDATLVFSRGPLEGGSLRTTTIAGEVGKAWLHLDLDASQSDRSATIARLCQWLTGNQVRTLNVAGPRESKVPGMPQAVARFLVEALAQRDE